MSDFAAETADYANELTHRGAARAPATFGEIWQSEWRRTGLDTLGGLHNVYRDAYNELVSGIETAAGTSLNQYARSQGVDLASAFTPDQQVAAVQGLVDTLPEDKRKPLEPLKDVRLRASQKAQQMEHDAQDVAGATYSLSGNATAFLAGISRQALDPANLLAQTVTLPIGGPAGGAILPFLARQAAAGAVAQAATEPMIESTRADLGLEAGFGRATENVLGAAGGAAGIAGLLRAGGAALRWILPHAAGELTPNDMAAAAALAERDQVTGTAPKDVSPIAHGALLDEATHALEDARPPDPLAAHAAIADPGADARPDAAVRFADAGSEAAPRAPELDPALSDRPLPPGRAKDVEAGTGAPTADPALAADAERALTERGGDLTIHVEDADGNVRKQSARDALAASKEDADAARELAACVGAEAAT